MKSYDTTITCDEAAVAMRDCGMSISTATLRDGIEQGIFPFGFVIPGGKSRKFYISMKLLSDWLENFCGQRPDWSIYIEKEGVEN